MELSGWGRYPRIEATVLPVDTNSQLVKGITTPERSIAYGMGRSYGDSALYSQVISSLRLDKFLGFDAENGNLTCESGVTLDQIIDVFLPRGWFLSVTPGTKFITVGGAIASDVHGKNHHKSGCFSEFVLSFDLMLATGEIVRCNPTENIDLFRATCGGMGLTGFILSATIKLQRVNSAFICETLIKCRNLKETFSLFEKYQSNTYSVAWVDCLAKGDDIGRSILMLGEHAETGGCNLSKPKTFSIPTDFPGFLLNRYSVSLFNFVYYHIPHLHSENRVVSLDSFFYPLDKIQHWNRMYGKRGFTQYQLVFPKESSYSGLEAVHQRVAEAGLGSFLAVLKLLGPENDNLLSFPMEGYTLALDFKIEPRLFPFLRELDRIVIDHGGRLYLAKDVRMEENVFNKGYPMADEFRKIRKRYGLDDKFTSLQSIRMGA